MRDRKPKRERLVTRLVSVMLHPAAVAGTNSDVLADAKMRDADGACTPRVTGSAVVQTNFVVSAEPSALMPMTRNVAETGMVMQSSDPLIVPRSSDQDPPGVFGWLLGKARTSWRLQGPGMQLPFSTSKVMPLRGSTDEEQAANKRSDAAAQKARQQRNRHRTMDAHHRPLPKRASL